MAENKQDRLERFVTPKRVFGLIAVLLIAGLLFMPTPGHDERAPTLSSYGTAGDGARGLYDLLDRLGFRVERRLRPLRDTLDSGPVYVLLEPSLPLTVAEVHGLLGAVRAGAALLVIPAHGSRLADSLGVQRVAVLLERSDTTGPADRFAAFDPDRIGQVLRAPDAPGDRDDEPYSPPSGATVFASVVTDRGREPAVVGLAMGRGRIVAVADPANFENAVIRRGEPAVRVVRLVEWLLDDDGTRPIVFDEYHHGYGTHADLMGVARRALVQTPPGRVLLHIAAAGLVLLLSIAVRPVRPEPQRRIQRRSPLEHVDALAGAYSAVHATDRATLLLVRGLHRRHGGLRGLEPASYLRAIADRVPAVAPDVERVLAALNDPAGDATGDGVTTSILRIERAITS